MKNQKKSENFSAQKIETALIKAGIKITELQLDQLWKFHKFLRQQNEELNMTRIYSFDAIVRKHYIDCLLVPYLLEKNGMELEGNVLDIGSGPGFPGIPLAIFLPNVNFVLAEGRHKRVQFLKDVVSLLQLKNTSVFGNRVHSGQDHKADIVITRAVESMIDTMRHSLGNAQKNALYIFMKGPNCDDEISELNLMNLYKLKLDEHYTLPDSEDNRRLVVWQKKENTMLEIISSKENKKFKNLKQLLQTKYIKKQQECIVSGKKIVQELMANKLENCIALLHEPQMPILETAISTWALERPLFKELDSIGTNSSLLLYSLKNMQNNDMLDHGIHLALPLQNPENLGAAIRSARAFGVHSIILFSQSAHFAHAKSIRASAGLSLTSNYVHFNSISDLIENTNLPIYGLSVSGESLIDFKPTKNMILIVGEEGQGLPTTANIKNISIPIQSDVDSLNASVALSIVLHKIYNQTKLL